MDTSRKTNAFRAKPPPVRILRWAVALSLVVAMFYKSRGIPQNDSSREEAPPRLPTTVARRGEIITATGILRNPAPTIRTLKEIKNDMQLPCNYVHDGYYLGDSNMILHQVYLSVQKLIHEENDDRLIPVFVESGGHDGITKSISLKSSVCLKVNTLLIEASPANYFILNKTRSYDTTVHAALCETSDGSITIAEQTGNSGANKVVQSSSTKGKTVPCTTLDDELDALVGNDPYLKQRVRLVFLVLDVEGYEVHAIQGLTRHSPQKAFMEFKSRSPHDTELFQQWETRHNLTAVQCTEQDHCYNFDLATEMQHDVFYGARKSIPMNTHRTSDVSKAYMFYGE